MANSSAGRAALGSSGKFSPDPAPRLNGPKALPPVATPVAMPATLPPPPITQEPAGTSNRVEPKGGPVIVMSPGVRAATSAGRSGSPVPSRPPPQPPSTTPATPSSPQNGKTPPPVTPPPPVNTKQRPMSAMPVVASPTPKPEPKPSPPVALPSSPSPPP